MRKTSAPMEEALIKANDNVREEVACIIGLNNITKLVLSRVGVFFLHKLGPDLSPYNKQA